MSKTTNQKVYRASLANIYALCPPAAHDENDAVLINPVSDAGTLGTSVHDACQGIACGLTPKLDGIAKIYNLDPGQRKELEILRAVAARFWQEYGPQFGDYRVEAQMRHRNKDGSEISGHQDVIGFLDGVCRVLDWKTTRLEAVNYKPQMMEYLWLAHHAAASDSPGKEAEAFQYVICFLRDKTVEVSQVFPAEAVDQWHDEYMASIQEWDGKTYHPGGHCGYCPRRAVCPGLCQELALLTEDYAIPDPTAVAETKVAGLTAEAKVSLWERIGMAQKFLEHAREIIKLHAEAAGGTLQGDGKALILKEQQRQSIKALEAWPIISQRLTQEELAPCVSISKTTLLDAVAEKAPRGGKKREKDLLMEELEAAGAVETSTYQVAKIVAALPAGTEKEIETNSEGV